MTTLLLIVIYIAFISLGLPDSLTGAGWPAMHLDLNVPISYAGMVTMIISAGTIISSLLSDRLTRRFKTGPVTMVSVALTAIALFGFSTARSFAPLCLWAIPYGLGAGAIDSALNNYVALHYTSRHMSWLHCSWGVGTIISPYIMSLAITHASWQSGYRWVSYIQIAITILLLVTLPLWRVHKAPIEEALDESTGRPLGLIGALRIRGVPEQLIGFFSYCSAESTVMLWAASYLVSVYHIAEDRAAAFASFVYIGITVGRFLAGFVSERLGDKRLIQLGIGVAAVGIVMVALPISSTYYPALIGFIIIGLGFAPVYPSVVHSTPSNFGAVNSQAIIGIQMASAYVGTTFMAPLFGLIAGHVSIRLLPLYIAIFSILCLVLMGRAFRITHGGAQQSKN